MRILAACLILLSSTFAQVTIGGTVGGTIGASASAVPTLSSPADSTTLTAGTTSESIVWLASTGASTYDYAVWTVSCGGTSFASGNTASLSVSIGSLTNGTTYYWQVRSVNTYFKSAYSSCRSFSVDTGAVLLASWYGATNNLTDFTNLFGSGTGCTVVASPDASGNAIRCPYGPVAANGGQPTDINVFFQKAFASLTPHYVSIQKTWMDTPFSDGSPYAQRKLSYSTVKQGGGDINGLFTNVLNYDQYHANNHGTLNSQYNGGDVTGVPNGSCADLTFAAYHIYQIESYFGSGTNTADGYINLSCDKVKDTGLSRTGINTGALSGADQVGFSSERWGTQLDTANPTDGWVNALYSNMTETQSGNTVTMTFQASEQHFSTKQAGISVIMQNCSDSRNNGIFASIAVPDQTKITYTNNNMTNVSGITGCTMSIQGHEYRYFHDIELWSCPGSTACTVSSAIN